MAIKINFLYFIPLFCLLFSCSKEPRYKVESKYNFNHTSTLYLFQNKQKKDSITINSYYGKDSVVCLKNNKWNFVYVDRCGTGCSLAKQIVFSVVNDKLISNLHIEAYYRESVLGDETFKKYFKRESVIKKIDFDNVLFLNRNNIKNDVVLSSKNEKLEFDVKNKIYFNSKFSYEEILYQGIKIDSSEYIFYNNKWYEFNNKKGKILCEM
jgi:hypothetical protein